MDNLDKNLWNCSFSHIYIEKEAYNYNLTKEIISKFKNSIIVEIDHYKDVFCKSHQDFVAQKNSPKLILAVKKEKFIYEGSNMCDSFGNDNFYYTSSVMNCIYNCEYCYLQGMYPSSNIVIFVNIEAAIEETLNILKQHPLYLCVSYDTDLMAVENITAFLHKWIAAAMENKNLKIEIRTKSANFDSIKDIHPIKNVILAWTISPDEIVNEFEKGTPSLNKRLTNICEAIDLGWKVRICFDPVLYVDKWIDIYKSCVQKTFEYLGNREVLEVSIGVFRVAKDYLKIMNKLRPNSKILSYPFTLEAGSCSYNNVHIEEIKGILKAQVNKYVESNKIYI